MDKVRAYKDFLTPEEAKELTQEKPNDQKPKEDKK